jgi:molybdenum cofactor cytidylyltransferase
MGGRYFAVIPAAGHSVRMGRPKLLLPYLGQPLIKHVLAAWSASRVNDVVVVVRPDDFELADAVRSCGYEPVVPTVAPPDMRASVEVALRQIEMHKAPQPSDAVLVAPADMPRLSALLIDRLMAEHRAHPDSDSIVPVLAGRSGHPILLRWPVALRVRNLPPGAGLDLLIQQLPARRIECDDLAADALAVFADVDTPDDYSQLLCDAMRGDGTLGKSPRQPLH